MMFHLCRVFPTTEPPLLHQLLTLVLSRGHRVLQDAAPKPAGLSTLVVIQHPGLGL